MTHTPPIPAGNTSPYPLHEPPHVRPTLPPVAARDAADADAGNGAGGETKTLLGIGAALVLGVGATVAALWFAGRGNKAPVAKRGRRKAPAKRKQAVEATD